MLKRTRLSYVYEVHRVWHKCPLSAFSPESNNIVVVVYFCRLYVGKDMTSAGDSGTKRKNPNLPQKWNLEKESSGRPGTFIGAILVEEKRFILFF